MRLRPGVLPYLSGELFSNGLAVSFDMETEDRLFLSRIDWLERLCGGKNVIHAGCVDHNREQIANKRRRGKWLHERLVGCTNRCLGIDRDLDGIEFLRDELGYTDVECLDLLHGKSDAIHSQQWDILLLGEILEHIDDPVGFLRTLKVHYAERVQQIIITVPNAFARENFRLARRNIEAINTDHRFWFTPYTLAKVVTLAGLQVQYLRLCRNGIIKKRTFIKNLLLSRRPLLRNNIILVATIGKLENP